MDLRQPVVVLDIDAPRYIPCALCTMGVPWNDGLRKRYEELGRPKGDLKALCDNCLGKIRNGTT